MGSFSEEPDYTEQELPPYDIRCPQIGFYHSDDGGNNAYLASCYRRIKFYCGPGKDALESNEVLLACRECQHGEKIACELNLELPRYGLCVCGDTPAPGRKLCQPCYIAKIERDKQRPVKPRPCQQCGKIINKRKICNACQKANTRRRQ